MERVILRLGGKRGKWADGVAGGPSGSESRGGCLQGLLKIHSVEDSQDQASLQVSPPQFILNMGLFNNPAWALRDHK